MHDMLKFDNDWKGTLVALALLGVYWVWDNKWTFLAGAGVASAFWIAQ